MMRLVEDGEMYRLRKFWDARKPECIESAKRNIIHVGIKEFSCALTVFGAGVVFSLLILAFEVIFHHQQFEIKLKCVEFKSKNKKKLFKSKNSVKGVIIPYVN